MTQVLVTDNLKKHFKSNFQLQTIKALDGVSMSVDKGEVFGFIGHNGAGKTTTIKLLTGLIAPTSGRAEVMGYPIGDTRSLKEIGFLPERPYFYEYLNPKEALRFYGKLSGMKGKAIDRRADELLEMLDLKKAVDRPMISFSKGMLQRFGVAQALIHDPHLVILDEPMSGLDPVGRGQIKDIIKLLQQQGKTVFFSTHILADVEQLCDRVALVASGRLWYSGTVEELTSRYEQGTEYELSDLNDAQRGVLAELPGTLERSPGGKAVLTVPVGEDTQALLKRLLEAGIHVERFLPKRTSLEEIFVREFKQQEEQSRASDRNRA